MNRLHFLRALGAAFAAVPLGLMAANKPETRLLTHGLGNRQMSYVGGGKWRDTTDGSTYVYSDDPIPDDGPSILPSHASGFFDPTYDHRGVVVSCAFIEDRDGPVSVVIKTENGNRYAKWSRGPVNVGRRGDVYVHMDWCPVFHKIRYVPCTASADGNHKCQLDNGTWVFDEDMVRNCSCDECLELTQRSSIEWLKRASEAREWAKSIRDANPL